MFQVGGPVQPGGVYIVCYSREHGVIGQESLENRDGEGITDFIYYIAAPVEKVWDAFVSKKANRTVFMGADLEVDLRLGGSMTWSRPGKKRKPIW